MRDLSIIVAFSREHSIIVVPDQPFQLIKILAEISEKMELCKIIKLILSFLWNLAQTRKA